MAVTGYAGAKRAHKIPDEMVKYESDPSRQEDIHTILLRHGNFMEDLNQAQKPGEVTQNRNLDSEMSKLYNTKMGKLLLEIEERYNAQVNKIADFKRRKYRVLITTSVTE